MSAYIIHPYGGGRIFNGVVVSEKIFVGKDVSIYGGEFYGGTFQGGVFRGGIFKGGMFEGGMFKGGMFEEGTFEGGIFEGGMFQRGVFRGGIFKGGTFEGGIFEGGVFEAGTFKAGTFEGGIFEGGVFCKSPICIKGGEYTFYMVENGILCLGCCRHKLSYWLKNKKKIFKKHGVVLSSFYEAGFEFLRETVLENPE